jgi:DNA gyrase subunit B
VTLADGAELTGEALERQLQRMVAYRKLLQIVTRRGNPPEMVEALLQRDVRDKTFFEHRDQLDELAGRMTTPVRTVEVVRDEEHNAFSLAIDDRSLGYPRRALLDANFVSSGEFRTLAAAYREIQDVRFPAVARTVTNAATPEDAAEEPEPETADVEQAPVEAAPQRAGRKDPDTTLADLETFVEFFIAAGKKGVAVNRYKGLGEMNPDTLWMTTMDPGNRTLLQVRAEDHAEADQMFTTLMGDQVEPRRKFIEDNALDVRNLDV